MGRDTLKTLGATNLSNVERSKLDYYGTDPRSTQALLDNETFIGPIWEPCAGHHLLVNKLIENGYEVRASDIAKYDGYAHEIVDFLTYTGEWNGDIVTNPPYGLSTEMAEKMLKLLQPSRKLAMFLRLQWLEGLERYEKIFSKQPPKTVYIFANRQVSSKDDDFTVGSAVAYVWIVWEKGYKGNPELKWLNTLKKEKTKLPSLFEEFEHEEND